MYFDATCPFAWVTSRWLKEVEKVRDIDLSYSPMSLAVLNEGRDELPEDYRKSMEAAWGPALVAAALQINDSSKVDAYYTAIGTLIHNNGEGHKQGAGAYDPLIAAALSEAGADASYLDYAHKRGSEDGSVEADLRAFQDKAMEKVGNDVGTPVVELAAGVVGEIGAVVAAEEVRLGRQRLAAGDQCCAELAASDPTAELGNQVLGTLSAHHLQHCSRWVDADSAGDRAWVVRRPAKRRLHRSGQLERADAHQHINGGSNS